jgi:Bacterial archaeo-eukaryotic release factor family 10
MFFPDALLDFARAHRDELTLSVYIESAPADPAARRNWRVRFRQGLSEVRDSLASAPADEQDAFERCAAQVLGSLPNGDTPATSHGWACFVAASGDAWFTHLRDATETHVTWGPGLRVVPFLRVATEPRALVVQVDRLHARIGRWHDDRLDPITTVEVPVVHAASPHMGDSPRVGFHEGTRGPTLTDEEQRHRAEAAERLLHKTRQRVVALVEPHEPILIGGAEEARGRLLELLPDAVTPRAVLVPELTMQLEPAPAAPVVARALHDLDLALRARRVVELREMAHARGRASVGISPARAAADLGALAELIFSERAWRQHPAEIEELVQRALFEGADVSVQPSIPGMPLDGETDGVIAGLRFPLPSMR